MKQDNLKILENNILRELARIYPPSEYYYLKSQYEAMKSKKKKSIIKSLLKF